MKELFDQYAIDKLALIHCLNLPQADVINLLVGRIMKNSLRAPYIRRRFSGSISRKDETDSEN